MALDNCRDEVKASIGRDKFTSAEEAMIARHAGKLKARIEAGGDPKTVLANFMAERQEAADARALTMAQNKLAEAKANERRLESGAFANKAPGEVLKSVFVSSLKQFKGAYDSLGRAITRGTDKAQGAFLHDLRSAGLLDYAFSRSDEQNIWRAYDALNNKTDSAQFGANADKAAKLLMKHGISMWQLQRDSNMPIGKTEGWIGPQMHDSYAIGRAGKNAYGSDAAAKQWISDTVDNLDWDKTFGGEFLNADRSLRVKRLTELWSQFVSGEHLRYGGGSGMETRQLHFKDADAQYRYNLKYGGGRSLAENVFGWLGRSARDVEIWNRAGSSPENWVRNLSNEWQKSINADETLSPAQRQKALDALGQAERGAVRHWIPALTNSLGHPEHSVARFVYNANSLINSLVVGGASIVLPGDMPLVANQIARYGGPSMQKYLGAGGGVLRRMMESKEHVGKMAALAEIMLQDMTRPMMFANQDQGLTRGVGYVNKNIMKLAGHTDWTDRIRSSTATAFGAFHWFLKDNAWSALEPEMQNGFERFGIGEKEWNVIRAQEASDVLSNVKAFGPAAIRDMELGHFKSLAADGASDAVLRRARTDVADKYRNFIGDMADRVTTSPSQELNALITLGTRPGSLTGMMVRMFNGLKSFTYNLTRNHYGAMIAGDRNPENLGLAALTKNWVRGAGGEPGGRAGMAKFAANNIAFGVLIYQLGLLRNGQQPVVPDTPEKAALLLFHGFLRQGAGMYGDLLFSQLSDPDHKTAENIVGSFAPLVGDSADMFDAVKRIGAGAAKYATDSEYGGDKFWKAFRSGSGQAAKVGYSLVPGGNLVWTKFATDWYLKDGMLDAINPGYKQRLTVRAQKEGAPYLLGPSQ